MFLLSINYKRRFLTDLLYPLFKSDKTTTLVPVNDAQPWAKYLEVEAKGLTLAQFAVQDDEEFSYIDRILKDEIE